MVALILWSVLAGIAMADDANELDVMITRHGIEVDGVVMTSIDVFKTSMDELPRTTPFLVGVESTAEIEMFLRVIELLISIGFEQVRAVGEEDPTWTLYPPMQESEIPLEVESSPEQLIGGENDS